MANAGKIFESWRSYLAEGITTRRRNVRGTQNLPKSSPEDPNSATQKQKPSANMDYRGTDPQIFVGPHSVREKLMDLKLDKAFINNVLAALKIDFEGAGFEILENKGRRKEIKLPNTLRALETGGKSLDPRQKKAVATIIINLLRLHSVQLKRSDGEWLTKTWAPIPPPRYVHNA